MKESENLRLFRHRFSRTIEVWVAYNVFLRQEIKIGDGYVCFNKSIAEQTTHTLLTIYYSYLYSLFDPTGTNFENTAKEYECETTARGKEIGKEILEYWEKIKIDINKIRHNIGFHGSKNEKSQVSGYNSYNKFNPLIPDFLMQLLRIYFREMDKVVETQEVRLKMTNSEETDALYLRTRQLKELVDKGEEEPIIALIIGNLDEIIENTEYKQESK